MDFLLESLPEIAGEVFGSVARLLNLDLDLVFVDSPAYPVPEGAIAVLPAMALVPRTVCVREFFFLSAYFACDGFEGLGEVVDPVCQLGEGGHVARSGAVGLDHGACSSPADGVPIIFGSPILARSAGSPIWAQWATPTVVPVVLSISREANSAHRLA